MCLLVVDDRSDFMGSKLGVRQTPDRHEAVARDRIGELHAFR
jgi:hypothetical protein